MSTARKRDEHGFAGSCVLEFLRLDKRPTLVLDLSRSGDHYVWEKMLLLENDAFRDNYDLKGFVIREVRARRWPHQRTFGAWQVDTIEFRIGGSDIRAITAEWVGSDYGKHALTPRSSPVQNTVDWMTSVSSASNCLRGRREGSTASLDIDVNQRPCRSRSNSYGLIVTEDNAPTVTPPQVPTNSCWPIFAYSKCDIDQSSNQFQTLGLKDWTQEFVAGSHYENLRAVDWTETSAGPLESWDPTLRSLAVSIMGNPYPSALYWGKDYVSIYNEDWRKIARNKDPRILGKPFRDGWPELNDYFLPFLDAAFYEGKITLKKSELVFLHRETMIEECYFDFTVFPIIGDQQKPVGVLEQAFDYTRIVITTRRTETLRHIGQCLATVRDVDRDRLPHILTTAFESNPLDSPFLLVYRTASDKNDNVQKLSVSVGIERGGVIAPHLLGMQPDACTDGHGFNRGIFRFDMMQAKETNSVVIKKLPSWAGDLGEVTPRGFGDMPVFAAIVPIQADRKETLGFLIIGLNPRRAVDGDTMVWLEFIRKELSTTAARIRLLKDEMFRVVNHEKEKVMRKQQSELEQQLQQRTIEVRRSELHFMRVAELLPVGLTLLTTSGRVIFANMAYKEMSGQQGMTADEITYNWRTTVYEEDKPSVFEKFDYNVKNATGYTQELRVGNGHGAQGWKYWVSATLSVERGPSGEVKELMFTICDITTVKKSEEYQKELSTQAVKRRRQQESFIDCFSHEVRNPLSASTQCADSLCQALVAHQRDGSPLDIEDLIDSSQTILICVQHQMRIIDDVLTLSKMDSMLLTVHPIEVRIHKHIAQTIRMFSSELSVKGIHCSFIIEDEYYNLGVDYVKADPFRFSQILVNLITNSIKFTSSQSGSRYIAIKLTATTTRPEKHGEVQYQIGETESADQPSPDYVPASGEPIYIQVMVEDSGIGISKDWQSQLFRRFEQAPRTHVTYGGSGLGLFISRRLCHLQGGEIGARSEEGKGSSFAFFIRSQRAKPPVEESRPPSPVQLAPPLARKPSTRQASVIALELADGPPPPLAPQRKALPYRVLIVEDNLINQEVLRRQLKKEGCLCIVANHGKEALEIIHNSTFGDHDSGQVIDIVLMDMEMPVMDGNTATAQIRAEEKAGILNRHVPILGISANARPEQVAKMTEAGMDAAIAKPFRIKDLIDKFAKLLRQIEVCSESSKLDMARMSPTSLHHFDADPMLHSADVSPKTKDAEL